MPVVDKSTSVEALTSRWHKLDDLLIQSPSSPLRLGRSSHRSGGWYLTINAKDGWREG